MHFNHASCCFCLIETLLCFIILFMHFCFQSCSFAFEFLLCLKCVIVSRVRLDKLLSTSRPVRGRAARRPSTTRTHWPVLPRGSAHPALPRYNGDSCHYHYYYHQYSCCLLNGRAESCPHVIFLSVPQGIAESSANSPSQQQVPSWYLTPQKLQVGNVQALCFNTCIHIGAYPCLCTTEYHFLFVC